MTAMPLYPLRFTPSYQYRPWGGRRLESLLSSPLPGDGPIGEAWLLSDRKEHASVVLNGLLKGMTIGDLMESSPEQLLGRLSEHRGRFPLLLKFLDVQGSLSVQVHPSDAQRDLIPSTDTGKTEAWVVLEEGPGARVYAGLKPDTTAQLLRRAIASGTIVDRLASFAPLPGDSVFIGAGTVHSLRNVVVFEVQQNSDTTFRLYDWDQVDRDTGQRRTLQIDQAMACIDFRQGAVSPVIPLVEESQPALRERLFHCEHFGLTRISGHVPFTVGAAGRLRVLVCLSGQGHLEHADTSYVFAAGNVLLLPAVVGACPFRPHGAVTLLEISAPEVL
jgi:mannose-6-phosphate isomerase